MSAWRIGFEAGEEPVVQRRRRRGRPQPPADETTPAPAPAAGGQPFSAVFDRLVKWIPGDTLALYVPGVTLLATQSTKPAVWFLVVMIIVTPLFVLGAAFASGQKFSKRVWAPAGLAALAFAIWSLSVPLSGWQNWSLVADHSGAVAIGAAIAGILFGFVAEGVVRRLPAD